MTLPKLAIHFTEGGRGDFLASVLLDSWREREQGIALTQPKTNLYYKMHYYERTPYPEYECVKIRIDDNDNINNMMQITYNQFLKSVADRSRMDDYLDHFYLTTRYYKTLNHQEQVAYHEYDYWIDFSCLSDIDFVKGLYLQIRNHDINTKFLDLMLENMSRQISWTTEPELVKLSKLIDFENRNHLMYWVKNFHLHEFMSSNTPEQYLNIQNYKKDGWN
jgi:hypothetical protein